MKYQHNIRTARFLQKSAASLNSICSLFAHNDNSQFLYIFVNCNGSSKTACEYSDAITEHSSLAVLYNMLFACSFSEKLLFHQNW